MSLLDLNIMDAKKICRLTALAYLVRLAGFLMILYCAPATSSEIGCEALNIQVKLFIDQITSTDRQKQAEAFTRLEALGMEAVPSIIYYLDDRRSLPPKTSLSLRNKSKDAFEGYRHYSPRQVLDALAALLNQITGKSFGFIYNGDTSDAERDKALAEWRNYLHGEFRLEDKP